MAVTDRDAEKIAIINSHSGFEAYVKLDISRIIRSDSARLLPAVTAEVKEIKDFGASPQIDIQGMKRTGLSPEQIQQILTVVTESGVDIVNFDLGGKKGADGSVETVPYVDFSDVFDMASLITLLGHLIKGSRRTTIAGLFDEGRLIGRNRAQERIAKGQTGFADSLFAEKDGQTIASALSDRVHEAVNSASTDREWYKAQAAGIVQDIHAAGLEEVFTDAIQEAMEEINKGEDISAQKANIAKLGALVYGAAAAVLVARSGVEVTADRVKAQDQEVLENYLFERARVMIYRNGALNDKPGIGEILNMLPGAIYLFSEAEREDILHKVQYRIAKEPEDKQWLLKFQFVEAVKKSRSRMLWDEMKVDLRDMKDAFEAYMANNHLDENKLTSDLLVFWVNYLEVMYPQREGEITRVWRSLNERLKNENDQENKKRLLVMVFSMSLGESNNMRSVGDVRNIIKDSRNPYVRRNLEMLSGEVAEQAEINIKAIAYQGDKPYMTSNRTEKDDEDTINFAITDLLNGLPLLSDQGTLRGMVENSSGKSFILVRKVLAAA